MALALVFLRKDIKIIGIVHDLQTIHLGKENFFKKIIAKLIGFFEKIAPHFKKFWKIFGKVLDFFFVHLRPVLNSSAKMVNTKKKLMKKRCFWWCQFRNPIFFYLF